jgi:molybdopterin/thiamine biosynthesis adenylyltransferase
MVVNSTLPLEMSAHVLHGNVVQFLARVRSIGEGEGQWHDATVGKGGYLSPGLLVRVSNLADVPALETIADAAAFLGDIGQGEQVKVLTESDISVAMVIGDAASARAWWVYSRQDGQRDVIPYLTIEMPDDRSARLPPSYADLAGKSVGLVGCGSLGSKIAVSLARAGVGSFVLVDDDIVTLGTLVRQDYPLEHVGAHKVDALSARLKSISPSVAVKVRRIKLGGQEAANTTSSVLHQFSECDIIIDGTANPKVFNLCGAVSTARRKPMVWAEVLAGGIGGFVGRARPDQDPPPQLVRRQLAHWCESQCVHWPPAATREYEAIINCEPVVADDADVTVVAGHAARFVLDLLSAPGRSKFPYSLYAVGMSGEWAFTEPFQTYPIVLEGTRGWGEVDAENAADNLVQALEILSTVLPKKPEQNDPSAAA